VTRKKIYLDFETRCELDLKKVGAYKYTKHPSCEIICGAYAIEGGPVETFGNWVPKELNSKILSREYQVVAHNAFFEKCVLENIVYQAGLSPKKFNDTAARAAVCALPRSLEGVALALNLTTKKDMDGNRLIKKFCKPTKAWTVWALKPEGPEPKKWHDDFLELMSIYDYCSTDVVVMRLVDKALPELTESEFETWAINQEMNKRGIAVDVELAKKVVAFDLEFKARIDEEMNRVTKGVVDKASKTQKLLEFLEPLRIEDVQAKTLKNLKSLDEPFKTVVHLRKLASKTSVKKYQAMINRADQDGRVRDLTLYHGASTGRDSGRGLQIQNLPRGNVKDVETAIEVLKVSESLDDFMLFYNSPLDVFSSLIRSMLHATPGKMLFVADYNAIEARVISWLSGNEVGLEPFRLGIDPYVLMASKIFRVKPEDVTDDQRFIGKTAILALGYQQGDKGFFKTATDWGAKGMTPELAKRTVQIYREDNFKIVEFWAALEDAAIKAVRTKGKIFYAEKISFKCDDQFLNMILPSGRKLYYFRPDIKNEPTPWGEMRPKLYFWGVESQTKRFLRSATYGGALAENASQATARDIMVNGVKKTVALGFDFLFPVHDEVVSESVDDSEDKLTRYVDALLDLPPWAKDLPLDAKGFKTLRYKK
jgi:DNA polymerase